MEGSRHVERMPSLNSGAARLCGVSAASRPGLRQPRLGESGRRFRRRHALDSARFEDGLMTKVGVVQTRCPGIPISRRHRSAPGDVQRSGSNGVRRWTERSVRDDAASRVRSRSTGGARPRSHRHGFHRPLVTYRLGMTMALWCISSRKAVAGSICGSFLCCTNANYSLRDRNVCSETPDRQIEILGGTENVLALLGTTEYHPLWGGGDE